MTDNPDMTLVPIEDLLEELTKRCIAMVVALDLAIDGSPDHTQMSLMSSGAMTNRLGLAQASSMRLQMEFQHEAGADSDFEDEEDEDD